MTQIEHDEVAIISQNLSNLLQSGLTFKAVKGEELKQLEKLVLEAGSKGYFGKITFAGQASNGVYNVQFNADNGTGYSSTWPEWAFELAKLALLYSKKVFIIANGEPFGLNLIQVLLFSQ